MTLDDLCALYLWPIHHREMDAAGTFTIVFDPPLTTAEQAVLATLTKMAKSHVTGLSLDEYQRMEPDLATVRTFRQMTQSEWMALTANAREKQTFDVMNALQALVRALLRDT